MSQDDPDVLGEVPVAESEMVDGHPEQIGADQPAVPHTGDPTVDQALSRLAEAADLPLEDQVGVFDAVHRTLQDRLADVDG